MKDHEIAGLVNQLRDVAIKYHATEQLRAQIHALIVPPLHEAEINDQFMRTEHRVLADAAENLARSIEDPAPSISKALAEYRALVPRTENS